MSLNKKTASTDWLKAIRFKRFSTFFFLILLGSHWTLLEKKIPLTLVELYYLEQDRIDEAHAPTSH